MPNAILVESNLTLSADHALQDPNIADHWGGDEEGVQAFLGENLHLVTAKNSKTNSVIRPTQLFPLVPDSWLCFEALSR